MENEKLSSAATNEAQKLSNSPTATKETVDEGGAVVADAPAVVAQKRVSRGTPRRASLPPPAAAMSLRPRGSLKPPNWIKEEMADEGGDAPSAALFLAGHRSRKRQSAAPETSAPAAKRSPTVVVPRYPAVQGNLYRHQTPTSRRSSSSAISDRSGSVAAESSEGGSSAGDSSSLVSRAMFAEAAELALKLHSEKMTKSGGGQRKNSAVTLIGKASAEDEAEDDTLATKTKEQTVRRSAGIGSIQILKSGLSRLSSNEENVAEPTELATKMEAAKRKVQVPVPETWRLLQNRRLKVVMPRTTPRVPRQIFPLETVLAASHDVDDEAAAAVAFDGNGEEQEMGTSAATALVTETPALDLRALLGGGDSSAQTSPHKSDKNVHQHRGANNNATESQSKTSLDLSMSVNELLLQRVKDEPLDIDEDFSHSEMSEAVAIADKIAAAEKALRHEQQQQQQKLQHPPFSKKCYALEDIQQQIAAGELAFRPISGRNLEARFFETIISKRTRSAVGFVKCKFCDAVFSVSCMNSHSEHIKSKHDDLMKFLLTERLNAVNASADDVEAVAAIYNSKVNGMRKNGANTAEVLESIKNSMKKMQTMSMQSIPSARMSPAIATSSGGGGGAGSTSSAQQVGDVSRSSATCSSSSMTTSGEEQRVDLHEVENVASSSNDFLGGNFVSVDASPATFQLPQGGPGTELIRGLRVSFIVPQVSNLFDFVRLLQSKANTLTLLLEHGILRNRQRCNLCGRWMKIAANPKFNDGFGWMCFATNHQIESGRPKTILKSIRGNSFFAVSRLPLLKMISFIYMWARDCTDEQIANELTIATGVAQSVSTMCREECVKYCDNNSPLIGGVDVVVELDEILMPSQTSAHGGGAPGLAMRTICGVDHNRGLAFMQSVSTNSPPNKAIRALVQKHVAVGSTIWTKDRALLRELVDLKGYTIKVVHGLEHIVGFLRRTLKSSASSAHQLTAERVWEFWCQLREMCGEGEPAKCAPFAAEIVFRQNARMLNEPVFNYFIKTIQCY